MCRLVLPGVRNGLSCWFGSECGGGGGAVHAATRGRKVISIPETPSPAPNHNKLGPFGQGCVRGEGGGRGVWLGTPSSQGPPMVPAAGGRKFLSVNPLGAKGAEAKFY